MIFPIVLIALLLCAEAGDVKKIKISECGTWACLAHYSCYYNTPGSTLRYVDQDTDVLDNCNGLIMIRPATDKKWLVILESWHPETNNLKVSQGSKELFACTKEGSKSKATSNLPGFKDLELHSNQSLFCQFFVGDDIAEILIPNTEVSLVSAELPSVKSSMKQADISSFVETFLTCDFTKVLFENTASPDDAVFPAIANLYSVVCNHPMATTLQHKFVSAYQNVEILCVEKSGSTDKYEYQIKIISDESSIASTTTPTDTFFARCHTKACTICSEQDLPTTPVGAVPPEMTLSGDCKKLGCKTKKFIKIDGESRLNDNTADKDGRCGKTENGEFKWIFDGKTVDKTSRVECVDEIPCKKITSGCSGTCQLNATSGLPFCPDAHKMSIVEEGRERKGVTSVSCNTNEGRISYKTDDGVSALPFDPSNVTFVCRAIPSTTVHFYQRGLFVNGTLGAFAILTGCVVAYTVYIGLKWKRQRDDERRAAGGRE